MSIEVISAIQSYMDMLNVFKEHGGIQVSHPDTTDLGFEFQPDDVVIFADFWTDECPDDATADRLATWYNELLYARINHYMTKLGYQEIEESDGSGGGLYYGCVVYRKK